jgi:hypothetical protein
MTITHVPDRRRVEHWMALPNEAFIKLMQVALEDSAVRETLLAVLAFDVSIRGYAIDQLVTNMQAQDAPADFVAAILCLKDVHIASTALDMLTTGGRK